MRVLWVACCLALAGCSGPSTPEQAADAPAAGTDIGANATLELPPDVVVAQGDMTIRWDYDTDGFEAWVATLYLPEPATVAWRAFPAGGGGGGGGSGEPELFALLAHPAPGLPCQDFTPALEKWAVPDFTEVEEAQLQPGFYHVLIGTDNGNGGGGLDINRGADDVTTGPRSSPLGAAVALEASTGNWGGGIDESVPIDAGADRSWFLWAQARTGPNFFLPRVDNGYELRIATDDGCYDESLTGPGPVTTESHTVRLHGSGSGATAFTAVYSQTAPTSAGNTAVEMVALVVTGDPATNATAP